MASTDPFEDVLNLEDKFYAEGHRQGVADGERAGRAEGRAFGIETAFGKFAEAGRLYGRALVWANRLPRARDSPPPAAPGPAGASGQPREEEEGGDDDEGAQDGGGEARRRGSLPRLAGGARLEKSVLVLHALVEPDTLATENTAEAVNDFDDRVKRAQGRARVVERQAGEDAGPGAPSRRDGGGAPAPASAPAAAAAATGVVGSAGGGDSARQTSSSPPLGGSF